MVGRFGLGQGLWLLFKTSIKTRASCQDSEAWLRAEALADGHGFGFPPGLSLCAGALDLRRDFMYPQDLRAGLRWASLICMQGPRELFIAAVLFFAPGFAGLLAYACIGLASTAGLWAETCVSSRGFWTRI